HFHPRAAFVLAKLARLLLVSGNVKQAINVINQIVGERALFEQLNPRQQNALYYLRAVAFLKLGKKTAAKDQLKMLLQRNPDNSLAKKLWKKLKQED
ncbi:MAG: tetratricopeptide repeat protein, partial [Caldisericaceae bacterium]|nr:tetratricopeptide repeat protein [Caldisericaceae bacterium]